MHVNTCLSFLDSLTFKVVSNGHHDTSKDRMLLAILDRDARLTHSER